MAERVVTNQAMGDIGDPVKHIEFEPLPTTAPVEEPAVALSMLDTAGDSLSRSVLARLANLYPEVSFHADMDALINEHGGVLHTWPEVDDGFWLQPVPPRPDPYTFMLSSLNASLRNLRAMGGI